MSRKEILWCRERDLVSSSPLKTSRLYTMQSSSHRSVEAFRGRVFARDAVQPARVSEGQQPYRILASERLVFRSFSSDLLVTFAEATIRCANSEQRSCVQVTFTIGLNSHRTGAGLRSPGSGVSLDPLGRVFIPRCGKPPRGIHTRKWGP
jgi:hypothetical protein